VDASEFHPETRAFFARRSVAVTGASGFIGSHVVEQLLALGACVTAVTRQASPANLAHLGCDIEIHKADLNNLADARQALRGASAVLHLAAVVGGLEFNVSKPATIFQTNLQCFFNAIQAARQAGVERFLVTSSACVYPRHCSIPTPETEGFLNEPEPTNSGYGWAKRMEEFLGAKYAAEFGLPVAIARPYNAYGPRDNFDPATSHVIPALIVKAFQTPDHYLRVWGDGSHSRSFLYVDDFARGLLEVAARLPTADAVNIGADDETTIAETACIIASLVSEIRKTVIEPVFDPAGLTGQPRRKCDATKARSLLGYEALVDIREGLKRTVEWFAATHENSPVHSHV
jgi:GDP-L-fucose synthase